MSKGATDMPDRNPTSPPNVTQTMETGQAGSSSDDGVDHPRRRLGAATAERFRTRIRGNKILNTSWRVAVFVVGILVVLAGIIMLVTPGPGWLGIVLGFAILASEFMWARRALRQAQRAAKAAKDKALDPRRRRRNQVVTVIAGVAVLAVCIGYLGVFGLTLPWNTGIAEKLPWVASVLPT